MSKLTLNLVSLLLIPGVIRYSIYGGVEDVAYIAVIIAAFLYWNRLGAARQDIPKEIQAEIFELKSKLSTISLAVGIKSLERTHQ